MGEGPFSQLKATAPLSDSRPALPLRRQGEAQVGVLQSPPLLQALGTVSG